MRGLVLNYVNMPKFLKKPMWRVWHNTLISVEKTEIAVNFMNYGYASTVADPAMINLNTQDEAERYGAQLYHFAASHTNLEGKDVLEVGCGRGGGASYIARYLRPRSYIGLDLSENGIKFCSRQHDVPNLKFVRGDAESLPFENEQFDALLNVESSRAYNHIERFFSEAYRVLKPGGVFLLTDMRLKDCLEELDEQVRNAGFRVDARHNITDNVVRALDIDDDRRKTLIRNKVPKPVLKMFEEFAGTRGSGRYASFASGAMQYVSYLLTKPKPATA